MFKYLLTLTIILFSGCTILSSFFVDPDPPVNIPSSKKFLDIPRYENGDPYIFWSWIKKKEGQLNLTQPELSQDSIIFRVWLTTMRSKKNQLHTLLELKYAESLKLSINFYCMRVDFDQTHFRENLIEYEDTTLYYKNNLAILDTLFKYKMNELPTDQNLENYNSQTSSYSNNASTFSFEYSTPSNYRYFQYNDILTNRSKYWQFENVVKFLQSLDLMLNIEKIEKSFWDRKIKPNF